ncbi:hypothetical protein RRG08_052420 [Elysia crispata]|uniref:Uncharacterized protein n=1 Tax=Elysia crispata TaxID=231223 RepID=A0AAE1E8V9_9GAST|nr:hypothetical protein RRG08_052420 [Elysia crispata]
MKYSPHTDSPLNDNPGRSRIDFCCSMLVGLMSLIEDIRIAAKITVHHYRYDISEPASLRRSSQDLVLLHASRVDVIDRGHQDRR